MRDRIARTIHASLTGAQALASDAQWSEVPDAERSAYLLAAHRILVILRSPTDAMLAEGNAGSARDAANVWETMIYRALHESG
jgi:hypothetical protein